MKNGKVEHMEQKKHVTAEHVEQENGRRKKISVNFMKNRMHIAQKHKIKIVKILKMTKKNIDDLLTLGELRTMIQEKETPSLFRSSVSDICSSSVLSQFRKMMQNSVIPCFVIFRYFLLFGRSHPQSAPSPQSSFRQSCG